MRDTQILSTFAQTPASVVSPARAASAVLVFDACHTGVVLRAVLFVESALAIGTMYLAQGLQDWVLRFSLATGAALPAVLLWLLLACALKQRLARWALPWQAVAAAALGAMSALYGSALLYMATLVDAPPWWASAFSGAWMALLLVAGLWMRAKGRAPADTAAQLAELQSRIRPHFLFNTLNSAIALVRAEPGKAETLLEDLSDLFRQALQDRGQPTTLEQELTLAQRYLAIEQVRFGERLRLQWQLDPAAQQARLPALVLQPLVENAVCHGVEPSPEGAEVRVSTQRRGSVVVIKVSNTVPAGPGQPGHGVGLRNVRERIALMHDVQGKVHSTFQDGIFQVRLEVPA
ncbi:MAG: sensor histidine kinase [Rhodoferax sp.]